MLSPLLSGRLVCGSYDYLLRFRRVMRQHSVPWNHTPGLRSCLLTPLLLLLQAPCHTPNSVRWYTSPEPSIRTCSRRSDRYTVPLATYPHSFPSGRISSCWSPPASPLSCSRSPRTPPSRSTIHAAPLSAHRSVSLRSASVSYHRIVYLFIDQYTDVVYTIIVVFCNI